MNQMTVDETEAVTIDVELLDRELLAEARRHLAGVPAEEAINASLKAYVEQWRQRRRAAHERIQAAVDRGELNLDRITEADW